MAKRLIYIVSEDWVFVSHRLTLAKQAIKDGYDVAVITNISNHEDVLLSAGLKVFNINFCYINSTIKRVFFQQILLHLKRPNFIPKNSH